MAPHDGSLTKSEHSCSEGSCSETLIKYLEEEEEGGGDDGDDAAVPILCDCYYYLSVANDLPRRLCPWSSSCRQFEVAGRRKQVPFLIISNPFVLPKK